MTLKMKQPQNRDNQKNEDQLKKKDNPPKMRITHQNEDYPESEDDLKKEDNFKDDDDLKGEP